MKHFHVVPAYIRSFKLESPSLQEGSSTSASMATGKDPPQYFFLFYHQDPNFMGVLLIV